MPRFFARHQGPSPRARGKPRAVGRGRPRLGSIPASAGEAFCAAPSLHFQKVHPRERGGSPVLTAARALNPGPSPRARGKLFLCGRSC